MPNCTDAVRYVPEAQIHVTFWPTAVVILAIGFAGLGADGPSWHWVPLWHFRPTSLLRRTWTWGEGPNQRRVSVYYLGIVLCMIIFMILKISGQSAFVKVYRDLLVDPGYECPCRLACLSKDEPGASSQVCYDRSGEEGRICYQLVGREGCWDYNEHCTNTQSQCTDEEKNALMEYWYGSTWLDGLVFYQNLASIAMPFSVIAVSLHVIFHRRGWLRIMLEISGPAWVFLAIGGSVWEILYSDFIGAPMGEAFTSLPSLCPETDDYRAAYRGKQLNSWATVLFQVFFYLEALEPFLVKSQPAAPTVREDAPDGAAAPEQAQPKKPERSKEWAKFFRDVFIPSRYPLMLLCAGWMSFLVTLAVLDSLYENVGESGSFLAQSYWSYGPTFGLCYSIAVCGLVMGYGYELFHLNGVGVSNPHARGPANYVLGAILALSTLIALGVMGLMLFVWGESWLAVDACFGLTKVRFSDIDIQLCESWGKAYNLSLYAMLFVTPFSVLSTYLMALRAWGTFVKTCERYDIDMSEVRPYVVMGDKAADDPAKYSDAAEDR